ncbi:MAG: hypothetical protein IT180_04320 [Acidobacteria bacterium]|nr:hypothetical protein [Acidobacteriota bacterium]
MDDNDYMYGFRPYVSVHARRARAARELATLRKKGRHLSPVVIEGRTIARTFWGEAWCGNLERYSDFANRLPRGRTYVRNGSVVDLQVGPGTVAALVSGTSLYDVTVTVGALPRARWAAMCRDCSGAIDSLVELLQGRFSKSVMTRLCQDKAGLFPSPKDILFTCSCPDWASMCKHVAAVLYGIGTRLDDQPELLFTLRKVDQRDLIAKAGSDLSKTKKPARAKVLAHDDLSEVFGIEIAPASSPRAVSVASVTTKRPAPAKSTASKKPSKVTASVKTKTAASRRPSGRPGPTPAKRRAIAERMRQYWAEQRAHTQKRKAAKR